MLQFFLCSVAKGVASCDVMRFARANIAQRHVLQVSHLGRSPAFCAVRLWPIPKKPMQGTGRERRGVLSVSGESKSEPAGWMIRCKSCSRRWRQRCFSDPFGT